MQLAASASRLGSVILGVLAVFWNGPAIAELPPGVRQLDTVEGITEYQLPNGLQVLLFPDRSVPKITVNITYRVGSRHEGLGETGMAHLLEHMVFKGTATFSNIWGALEDHGASFNGTTWFDRTNYFETLPATAKNLDFALRMEADRMVNSLVREEDLAKEMTVVRNEFEMGENSPTGVLSERLMSTAFLWHNYGKSTIGNRSDIERVPAKNLRRFYRKYYQPDNATLLVAGDFDPAQALALIHKYFAAIPRPVRVLQDTYTDEPAQDGPRLVTLKRVGDVPTVGVVYHIPAGTHADFPAIEMLQDVLTNQPAGHLYRGLVANGLASTISGAAFALAEPGVIQFTANVADGHTPEEVLARMVDLVEETGARGVTEQEVEAAKARAAKEFKLAMTNSGRIGVVLSEFIAQGDWRLFFLRRDRIEGVTSADVQRVASAYLQESNRTAGMFIPTESPSRITIPPKPNVTELVKGYKGRDAVAQGEKLVPEVPYLEARITRKTLPSGIRVALLPMKTRGEAVRAAFTFRVGSEDTLTGRTTAFELIPLLLKRGTKRLNFEALRDEIDRLQSRIDVSASAFMGGEVGDVSASILTDRARLAPALELLGEILKEPAFDAQEFDLVRKRLRAQLEQGLTDPRALGMIELRRATNPYEKDHVHYVPTLAEQIERLDAVRIEDVKSLHDSLYGASKLDVALVGDFDPDQAIATLEKVFGTWKSKSPYVRIAKPFRPVPGRELTIDTPDKEMAMVALSSTFVLRDDDERYPAIELASYVLGRSAKSRLLNRLRHEGGLSYGAGGGVSASSKDERGGLMGMAICAPQNAEEALQALTEEIKRWIAEGITQQELDEAKNSYLLKYQSLLGTEDYLLGELLSGLDLDRTLQFKQKQMDRMKELTVADIQKALQSVLQAAPLVTLRAGDPNPPNAMANGSESASAETDADAPKSLPPFLVQFDKNGDGRIALEELPESMRAAFKQFDANEDGAVDGTEAEAALRQINESRGNAPGGDAQ